MNDDKKYETIGRMICKISYWIYALKFIAAVSIIVGVVLFFLQLPLWIAPIIGIVVFFIYRFIRRLIFSVLLKLSRM